MQTVFLYEYISILSKSTLYDLVMDSWEVHYEFHYTQTLGTENPGNMKHLFCHCIAMNKQKYN